MTEAVDWTIIVPVFNEVESVEHTLARLRQSIEGVMTSYEVILVDDGSTDGSGQLLDRLAEEDCSIRALHFSRNFGHMAALTAGMEHARARKGIVTLDADGQHPPEMIPAMVVEWQKGADIVQTVRESTESASFLKESSARVFYWALNRLADLGLPAGAADFRLLDRQVVDAINSFPESNRFLRGLVFSVGFQTAMLPYRAEARHAGQTKYTLRRMAGLALSAITSFSTKPLKLSILLGGLTLVFSLVYGLYVLLAVMRGDESIVPGWSSLIVVILFFSSVQLICLGLLSEYMGRLYMEAKRRPAYILRTPACKRTP